MASGDVESRSREGSVSTPIEFPHFCQSNIPEAWRILHSSARFARAFCFAIPHPRLFLSAKSHRRCGHVGGLWAGFL